MADVRTTAETETPYAALERYRPLVDDWEAFTVALARPRPTCVVANRARLTTARLRELLQADGLPAEPPGWTDAALRVPADSRPGIWWPHLAGLYQVQEEASLLPVHLLDPQPGERILDLCAAPGGKAAQIAMALGGRGTVIANDKDSRRLAGVRDKMKRLGLLNLTATVHDGGDFPLSAGAFDRVLVDAPCSAEGTNFAGGAAYAGSQRAFRHWVAGQQRALLRRAAVLVKPGGRIVYSTCSFAPEENEAVVDAVLTEARGSLRACPPELYELPYASGVRQWAGLTHHPDVAHAVRLWPHQSGTGGFFAIALERSPTDTDTSPNGRPSQAELGVPVDMETVLQQWTERYGLPPERLAGLAFLRKGDEVHTVADDHAPPRHPQPVASGIPVLRTSDRGAKPATAAALRFFDSATRNRVELTGEQAEAYLSRRPVDPEPGQLDLCAGRGHVIVTRHGHALGAAFLNPGPPPRLDSQYPRAWVPHARRR